MAKEPEKYSEEETAKRRDEVIRRMLKTPPKPHNSPKKNAKSTKKAKK